MHLFCFLRISKFSVWSLRIPGDRVNWLYIFCQARFRSHLHTNRLWYSTKNTYVHGNLYKHACTQRYLRHIYKYTYAHGNPKKDLLKHTHKMFYHRHTDWNTYIKNLTYINTHRNSRTLTEILTQSQICAQIQRSSDGEKYLHSETYPLTEKLTLSHRSHKVVCSRRRYLCSTFGARKQLI